MSLLLLLSGSGDGSFVVPGTGYELTIAGVPVSLQPGWTINAPANGVGTMNFEVVSLDGSYVPARDAEVIFTADGLRIFGGTALTVRERGLANLATAKLVSEVTAVDFNALAGRLYFGAVIAAGTLKYSLQQIVGMIPGATLDPAQVDGPSLPAIGYDGWLISDILDQLALMTGYVWEVDYTKVLRMFAPGTLTAPFDIAVGDGHAIGDVTSEPTTAKYANVIRVWGTGVNGYAENAGEIAAHGTWEWLIKAPDATTQDVVDRIAIGALAASLPFAKRVTYTTYSTERLTPGQTQTITLPTRHLNNTFLLTEIQSTGMEARDASYLVRHRVSAIEGLVYQTGWREAIKAWGGSSSGGGVSLPGGGGGTAFQRFAYFLGGSGLDFVQSPTPTWIAANPMLAQINTVPRGTTDALVTVRLRSLESAVSVQARLFDYTDNVACAGVSAVVNSTSWTTVAFTATLTAGSHYYGLQLLPGSANADVGAIAYVE